MFILALAQVWVTEHLSDDSRGQGQAGGLQVHHSLLITMPILLIIIMLLPPLPPNSPTPTQPTHRCIYNL